MTSTKKIEAPKNDELILKAIKWWRKQFPESSLRPSSNLSSVMYGKWRWGFGKTQTEGPYVLLRSHDGGQELPFHAYTICGLFRWTGRKIEPVLTIDGHAEEFMEWSPPPPKRKPVRKGRKP